MLLGTLYSLAVLNVWKFVKYIFLSIKIKTIKMFYNSVSLIKLMFAQSSPKPPQNIDQAVF